MENIVEVRSLTKDFGTTRAVDDLSFDIKKGEIIGLLGHNGAGKTTTIQMLLGLTTPTSGSIKVFGLDYKDSREEILSRVNFSSSYVSMPYSLTVYENLKIFCHLYGVKNVKERIDEVIELFNIGEFRNLNTRRLSSGQVTRICLAKAFINNPEIIFLDEPTASLDVDIADKTREIIKKRNSQSDLTVLVTSHNIHEMEDICNRILIMDKGNIIVEGTPEGILDKHEGKNLEEVFLKIIRGEDS